VTNFSLVFKKVDSKTASYLKRIIHLRTGKCLRIMKRFSRWAFASVDLQPVGKAKVIYQRTYLDL